MPAPAHNERVEMLGDTGPVPKATKQPLDFEARPSRHVSLTAVCVVVIFCCGLTAAAFFIGREIGRSEGTAATPASAPFSFSCDAKCIAAAARLQGADVLTDVDALAHSIEVQHDASQCGPWQQDNPLCNTGDVHCRRRRGHRMRPKRHAALPATLDSPQPLVAFEADDRRDARRAGRRVLVHAGETVSPKL